MIDYHCHILPSIDDGPAAIEESLRMAQILSGAGYRDVYCTPHLIKGLYDAPAGLVLQELRRLQQAINREGIPLQLHSGREYFLDEYLCGYLDQPMLLEGTDYLLVEIPSNALPSLVKETLFSIVCKGHVPVIAHPERCSLLQFPASREGSATKLLPWPFRHGKTGAEEPARDSLLCYLRDIGCKFQENMGSRQGRYGPEVRTRACKLKAEGIYTHFGTDAHNPDALAKMLRAGYSDDNDYSGN